MKQLLQKKGENEKSSNIKIHTCNGLLTEVEDQVMRDKRNK
jgi:hypothetical protein